jgi:hydrogenase maturation protease
MGKLLVIGIGNCLRGDDGIGAQVIGMLEQMPGVAASLTLRTVHQLDLSHAGLIKDFSAVIFIDADCRHGEQPVRVEEVFADGQVSAFTSHIGSIANLLAVTEAVYGKTPRAFLVAVRGVNFEIDAELSPEALVNAEKAAREVISLGHQLLPGGALVPGAGPA